MEWKKQARALKSKKSSTGDLKITISAHEKQTKRKKTKHRKVLTEDLQCTENVQRNWNQIVSGSASTVGQTHSSLSKSHHAGHHSSLFEEFTKFGQEFQQENDRLRQFIEDLQFKNRKRTAQQTIKGSKKESIAQKIKKQSIMLKSSTLCKPSR